MAKFAKGNNSEKKYGIFFFKFSPGYLLITLYYLIKFEAHSYNIFEISWLQNIILTLQKGHNSTKTYNPDLKKNMWQLFFDEESIYEISKLYLNKFWMDGRMDGLTDGRSEVPNGPWPLQIYGINLTRLTPQAHFNPITPSYPNPNLTKHCCTDCEHHNVSWACTNGWTDRRKDARTSPKTFAPSIFQSWGH